MKAKVKTWLRNVENGNIRNFTEVVLNAIKERTPVNSDLFDDRKGISTHELREDLVMSHQSLTAILSNLNDEGLIKAVSQIDISESTYSVYVFIHDLSYRERVITKRKEERYVRWLKNADQYFEFMGHETVKMISYEQQEKNVH